MPINYNKETHEWIAENLGPEEIEQLIRLGQDELLRMMAVQMFKQMSEMQNPLAAIPKEEMGNC